MDDAPTADRTKIEYEIRGRTPANLCQSNKKLNKNQVSSLSLCGEVDAVRKR